jgi:hypothetical protein
MTARRTYTARIESAFVCQLVVSANLSRRHATSYVPLVRSSPYARVQFPCIMHNAGDLSGGGRRVVFGTATSICPLGTVTSPAQP